MTKLDPSYHEAVTRSIARLTDDPVIQKLLAYSFGRVILNEVRRRNDARLFVDPSHQDHIRDWLVAAVANDEPWLKSLDDKGRPKKLMKFSTVEGIVAEADKAMRKFAEKNREARIEAGDEELAGQLADGWYVVKLLTPVSLDRESGQMQHCIGQGGYDDRLTSPEYAYYSLRDPAGHPHVTMEVFVATGTPLQIQGKQNREPIPAYLDRMLEFMKTIGVKPRQLSRGSQWVFDIHGDRHDIEAIPEGTEIAGTMTVTRTLSFPRNLTVTGDLRIYEATIGAMPDNLDIGGSYTVEGATLPGMPSSLRVGSDIRFKRVSAAGVAKAVQLGGNLEVIGGKVTRLPTGLSGHNSVWIEGVGQLHGIGQVRKLRKLYFESSKAPVVLPEGLELDDLVVVNSDMLEYPVHVTVLSSVYMANTGLIGLPDNLELKGNLMVAGNPIRELPKGLRVNGDLDIQQTGITSFPLDMEVCGRIVATDTPLASLDGLPLSVKGLNISGTNVTAIPAGFTVSGDLIAKETPLAQIGEAVTVGGKLDISKTNVVELPSDISVAAGLDASYSSLRSLPEGFETEGDIRLDGSDLRSLPAGLVVRGKLNVSYTPLAAFPDGVVVEGDLDCVSTGVRKFPADLFVDGNVNHPLGTNAFPQSMDRMIQVMARAAKRDQSRKAATP